MKLKRRGDKHAVFCVFVFMQACQTCQSGVVRYGDSTPTRELLHAKGWPDGRRPRACARKREYDDGRVTGSSYEGDWKKRMGRRDDKLERLIADAGYDYLRYDTPIDMQIPTVLYMQSASARDELVK